jgi:hypothetical protein
MNLSQYLLHGSHHQYLRTKIFEARRHSMTILHQLEDFGEDEQHNQDSLLMQHFLLEQLPLLQRIALRPQLFQFDQSDPERVKWYLWFAGWILECLIMCAMLVWILIWAVSNGQRVFKRWLGQFIYCLLQDVFVSQVLLVLIVHVFVIEHLQPQLKHLSHTLNFIILQKLREAAKQETRSKNVVNVVQHLSSACRVSRVEKVHELPSAMLLRDIEDRDINWLRIRRDQKLSVIATLLIGLPIAFGLAGDNAQDMLFDILVACTWGAFLLFNHFLLTISFRTFVAVYASLGTVTAYYILVYRPRMLRQRRAKLSRGTETKARGQWMRSFRVSRTPAHSLVSFVRVAFDSFTSLPFSIFNLPSRQHTAALQLEKNWKNMNLLLRLPSSVTSSRRNRENWGHCEDDGCPIVKEEEEDDGLRSLGGRYVSLGTTKGFESSRHNLRAPSALTNFVQPAHVDLLSRTVRVVKIPSEIQELRVAAEVTPPLLSSLHASLTSLSSSVQRSFFSRRQDQEVRWSAALEDQTLERDEKPLS